MTHWNKLINSKVELEKNLLILSGFFLIRNFNPFFYELVIDSINVDLTDKTQKFQNSKISSKTLAMFTLYLNIFSTIKLGTQKKEVNKRNMVHSIMKDKLLQFKGNEIKNSELNHHNYVCRFFDLFLSRSDEVSLLEVRKSIQMIESLNNL